MNRVRPSRRRWYSSATGSLTFITMSASPQTSSAVPMIVAPWETYSSSADRGAETGTLLHEHLVAATDELVDPHGGDADPELVVLDLAGDTDLHGYLALSHSTNTPAPLPRRLRPVERDASLDPGRGAARRREEPPNEAVQRHPRPAPGPGRRGRRPRPLGGAVGAHRPARPRRDDGARRAGSRPRRRRCQLPGHDDERRRQRRRPAAARRPGRHAVPVRRGRRLRARTGGERPRLRRRAAWRWCSR